MKVVRIMALLGVVQLLLLALYVALESRRTVSTPFVVESLDLPAPSLVVSRAAQPTALPDQPHLVHFWATWCGPCLEELPALLDATEAEGVPLLAVTDEDWPVVERYFKNAVPAGIVRDPSGDATTNWQVSGLPDTFVLRNGRVVGRMGGPRNWNTPEARAFLRTLRSDP